MKSLRRASFIALGCALLAACGTGLPPAGNYATVFGRVTDSVTGSGVANATVALNGGVLTAATDAAGNFRITPVPTGDWDYTVSAPGYKSLQLVTNPMPLTPGEQRSLTVPLAHS